MRGLVRISHKPAHRAGLGLWAALWAIATASCGQTRPDAAVEVRVVDMQGQAVEGALLRLDGKPVGRASSEGALHVTWPGARRGRVELSLECGDGLRSPPPRRLRARHAGTRRIEMVCEAESHRAWLAILAPGGEGLPVRVDGQQVAEIGAQGVVHAQVIRPAGSEVRVRIDTSQAPALRPQNPVVRANLDRDRLLVMQPRFERVHRRRRGAHRASPVTRPRRLRSL